VKNETFKNTLDTFCNWYYWPNYSE